MADHKLGRRAFVRLGVQAGAGVGLLPVPKALQAQATKPNTACDPRGVDESPHGFNGIYKGPYTEQIAFPMGGIGAGMICLEGSGALSKLSLRHKPELEGEQRIFAAVSIRGAPSLARVLEGPVPHWKLRPQFPGPGDNNCWGLPRFHIATFAARFPFGTVDFEDDAMPLQTSLTGWSPFCPGDADNASLPVAGLEYRFLNRSRAKIEGHFSFNAENFLAETSTHSGSADGQRLDRIRAMPGGFILYGPGAEGQPWDEGWCAAWVDEPDAVICHAWPLDSLDLLWRRFAAGECPKRAPLEDHPAAGASVFVPFTLAPDEIKTVTVCLAWYVPNSNLFEPQQVFKDGKQTPCPRPQQNYRPWYAGQFARIEALAQYWRDHYQSLKKTTLTFSQALQDSTLPPEVTEAVSSNLSILKSTTVLRQTDGRLWGWEGSYMGPADLDKTGVSGTTTHVWNYAQALPHLFPALERGLRETELGSNQNEEGLQYCRTPLPIRPVEPGHIFPDGAAADGQLGGIIKVYREWRVSGDTAWLHRLWPRVRASLDYCIRTWDPDHQGWIKEPHVTTYDMEFWGADSLCTSLYVGALQSAVLIGKALHEPVDFYSQLLSKAVERMNKSLFNGEYFFQDTVWTNLRRPFLTKNGPWAEMYGSSREWQDLIEAEGPAGQYGTGCLSDGVMGVWLCAVSGLESLVDPYKVESHLSAAYRYNFSRDLTTNANLMRAPFACNADAGLVSCTWPRDGRPSMPMIYSDEVWTGTEYQVASHLIMVGQIDAGINIVRAVRRRYDGRVRNPFDEVEAGSWYARAMSSYALLQAFSGARFDAVDKVLYLQPRIEGDFRCFLATETGFGTVGVKEGKPFVEVVAGDIPYRRIDYRAA